MISSEVQRTLVKSPPELWSELSDPQSLARHLGELGEIEITRVEPENLVEWEAEGTTGTVQIKPSGWGTRVTLTVSRELPAGESAAPLAEEAPAPGEAEAGSPADASPTEAGSEPPAEAGPEPSLELETPADAQEEPETQAHTPSEAEAGDPPLGSESAAEDAPHRKPAPATEAARRAAGWPSSELEPAPAIESEPHAAEAFDPPAEPDGLQAWAVQAAIEPPEPVEHDELSPAPEPAPAAEPRRGFLARLFVRRRKPTAPADAAPVASFLLKAEDAEPADQDLELLDPLDEPVADAAETTDELLDPLDGPIADAAEAKEEPDLAAEEKAEPVGAPAPEPDAPPSSPASTRTSTRRPSPRGTAPGCSDDGRAGRRGALPGRGRG